jgi:light-regulated signal transduction histidine kinase (bacteriophytochrome)
VESLLAAPESWLEGVAAEDRERIAQVIANGRDSGFYEAVFRVVRTDGTLRWVHSRAYELRDTAGRAYRVTGIIDDVTARRQGEEEIHALARTLESRVAERTAALELANRELEAFSYSVSHDLRAPLRAMSGYAHLLADDTDSRFGPDGRKMLERIRANAEHMGELIEDILEFSRVGRNELRHDRIDMTALAQGVADEMHDDYPQAKFEIGALPVAHGDPAMLRQVWINLICNALKFSSKRAEPRIEIGGETAADGTATWFVRDNGAGFDMTYAARLFGVFQRLHRADDYPGTGAGLAIVKRIVTRHGGRIEAESVLDGGATFRFSLPGAN